MRRVGAWKKIPGLRAKDTYIYIIMGLPFPPSDKMDTPHALQPKHPIQAVRSRMHSDRETPRAAEGRFVVGEHQKRTKGKPKIRRCGIPMVVANMAGAPLSGPSAEGILNLQLTGNFV
jgi:hypothetical protein